MGNMDRFGVGPTSGARYGGDRLPDRNVPSSELEDRPGAPAGMADEEMRDIARQLEAAYAALGRSEPLENDRRIEPVIRIDPQALAPREVAAEVFDPAADIENALSRLEAIEARPDSTVHSDRAAASFGEPPAARAGIGPLRAWMSVVIAAAIAFVAGSGVGYLMKGTAGLNSEARIHSTLQGGTQLQLDYELRSRTPAR